MQNPGCLIPKLAMLHCEPSNRQLALKRRTCCGIYSSRLCAVAFGINWTKCVKKSPKYPKCLPDVYLYPSPSPKNPPAPELKIVLSLLNHHPPRNESSS